MYTIESLLLKRVKAEWNRSVCMQPSLIQRYVSDFKEDLESMLIKFADTKFKKFGCIRWRNKVLNIWKNVSNLAKWKERKKWRTQNITFKIRGSFWHFPLSVAGSCLAALVPYLVNPHVLQSLLEAWLESMTSTPQKHHCPTEASFVCLIAVDA